MMVAIYFILYLIAIMLHFLDSEYGAMVLFIAQIIPLVDFMILTIQDRKLTRFNFSRSSSFFLIAFINSCSFSYDDLSSTPKLICCIWIVVGFVISVWIKRKFLKYFAIRIIIFSLLTVVTIFNAYLSPIQRMYVYTIGNPFYSNEVKISRMHDFAYLYYEIGDLNNTFLLLNRCKVKLRQDLAAEGLTDKKRQFLIKQFDEVDESYIAVLQGNWERNELKFLHEK